MLKETHERLSGRKIERRTFDSVAALIEYALQHKGRRPESKVQGSRRALFVGRDFGSWQKVLDQANDVWTEGLDVIEDMANQVDPRHLPQPKVRRRRTRFGEVDGNELDIDRLMGGANWWRTSERQATAGPALLTLAIDTGANANRNTLDILWRGAVAIVLAEVLEAAGYRVAIWAYNSADRAYTDGTACINSVCLKEHDGPLDRSTLCNAVSGWFHRTIQFEAINRSHDGRRAASGLGSHRLVDEAELAEITGDQKVVKVDAVWSRAEAIDKLSRMLEEFCK